MRLIGPLQMAGDALEAPKGRVGERLILATQPFIGGGTRPSVDRRCRSWSPWRLKQAAVNTRLT